MEYVDLNRGWQFFKAPGDKAVTVDLPHDAMVTEHCDPACANGMNTGYYPGGNYIYEKKLFLRERLRGCSIFLAFEGIYEYSRIYVNGSYAGGRDFGYADFYLKISPLLKYGEENTIRVEADNDKESNSRWYTGSGIYRPVHLIIKPPVHIAVNGVRISTRSLDPITIDVEVVLENETDFPAEIPCSVQIGKLTQSRIGSLAAHGTERIRFELKLPEAKLWSHESPNLTECYVTAGDDEETVSFGIRTIHCSAERGFLVNGHPIRLYGVCLHHDNGFLGAAAHEDAEWRRVKVLKSLGYNAIRSAHNPMSRAMLNACDSLGMYVMDELYDMWLIHKNANDYADRAAKNYLRDIAEMTAKDFNHPSAVMYSIGNEISETAEPEGIEFGKELVRTMHEADPTRPVTSNVNFKLNCLIRLGMGVYHNPDRKETDKEKKHENAGNRLAGSAFANFLSEKIHYLMEKLTNTELADRTSRDIFACLDIAGYSYGQSRYETDFSLYPERVIVGSETYIRNLPESYAMMQTIPNLIGDFVWAGWDYLGEAGIGSWDYVSDTGNAVGFFKPYPWKLAVPGMVDMTGQPTVHGRYAETILKQLTRPYIAVSQPNHYREKHGKSVWGFTNALHSWNYPGHEGCPVTIEIYSAAPVVEVLINNKSLGRRKCGRDARYRTLYKSDYQAGEITARSYDGNGCLLEETSLISGNGEKMIRLSAPEQTVKRGGLVYVDAELCDSAGIINVTESGKIRISVKGNGQLLGVGSACASSREEFTGDSYSCYRGRMQAIVRAGNDVGDILICADSEGYPGQTLRIMTEQPEFLTSDQSSSGKG